MAKEIGSLIIKHELSNGITCEIREAEGFGNRSEVAFFIEKELLGTFVIDKKRSGNVEIKPSSMRAFRIKPEGDTEDVEEPDIPSLDDIVPGEDDQVDTQ